MKVSPLVFFIVIAPLIGVALCYSEKLYDDFYHYAHYSALSACITHDRLSEGYMKQGACDLNFCYNNKRNQDAQIIKIRNAGRKETGTGFLTLDKKSKQIILSFRGSTTATDWASDLQMMPVDYRSISRLKGAKNCFDCKVHYGFYKDLETIYDDLVRPVDDLFAKYQDFKLIVVGHSLGGAIATLVGIEFRIKGYEPLVITYGSPKLLNGEMAHWVNDIFETERLVRKVEGGEKIHWGLIRLVHDGDYVPMLPPSFTQAGLEFFINKKDLPFERKDITFLGSKQIIVSERNRKNVWDLLNGYEHRTYFLTINKCEKF